MFMGSGSALSKDEIMARAPSVFATEPCGVTTSKEYGFVSSVDVLKVFEDLGWKVFDAQESRINQLRHASDEERSRNAARAGYQKHLLRLRNYDIKAFSPGGDGGDEVVPEVLFVNSHDGSNSFNLDLGLFRFVCVNGMVSADQVFNAISIKHQGFRRLDVTNAIEALMMGASNIWMNVERMKDLQLDEEQRFQFAEWALDLKESKGKIDPLSVVQPIRVEDTGHDLFSVFNVAQEHLIKGGLTVLDEDGKSTKTRPIKSISQNLKVNRELWDQANQTLELLAV